MAVFAYIGLGSNLGDRRAMIADALERLKPRRVSSVVETAPWGRVDQPAFLNAVAEIETDLEPDALLDRLLDLERGLGRVSTSAASSSKASRNSAPSAGSPDWTSRCVSCWRR